jgi:phytoene desaturase
VGIRTRRGELRADAVVLNADFGHAVQRLVPERLRRRWSDKTIGGKRWSCSTFMMYLGLDGRLDELAHHTIFLSKDYAENIATIERGTAPPERPSFYVQNPGITDPTLAPPGHSTLYVLVPVANLASGAIDWAAEQQRYRAHVLTQLEKVGIRDIERRIRFEKIVTPREWESDLAVYRGATFNLSHDLGQMLHFRPRNRFEDVDGLYLVGGGTHPGSGLPVIFESARISTRLLAADLGVEPLRMRDAALQPALASS